MATPLCTLCGEAHKKIIYSRKRLLYECGNCCLIFADPADRLPQGELRRRYLLHENSVENKGYVDFLTPVIQLAKPYLKAGSSGLDFGCGPGPTLSKLAEAEGFVMDNYDPIFFDQPLKPPYDFIFSTECFEHFDQPKVDITKVLALLREGGVLAVMTELWNASKDFDKWAYAADPSHVSFYTKETITYICKTFKLKLVAEDQKRVFVFNKGVYKKS